MWEKEPKRSEQPFLVFTNRYNYKLTESLAPIGPRSVLLELGSMAADGSAASTGHVGTYITRLHGLNVNWKKWRWGKITAQKWNCSHIYLLIKQCIILIFSSTVIQFQISSKLIFNSDGYWSIKWQSPISRPLITTYQKTKTVKMDGRTMVFLDSSC